MIELTGISLSERQKELYSKINDAAKNKIDLEEIISRPEKSDVDKLYKIGVASKYKDVEYIIEILKSGDSLYISKALKCIWLYDNEYSHIINPEYLHENVFPLISLKMTKKFLTAISLNIRDEQRAVEFYTYCKRSMKHTTVAMKFLLFISEESKLESLKDENVLNKLKVSDKFLKLFVGKSFVLAEAYYNATEEYLQINALRRLGYLYFISNVKYLEMLRKLKDCRRTFKNIGLRISKDIIRKHKDAIYKNPMVYLRLLNKDMLLRYSTVEDFKLYVKSILAYEYSDPDGFWHYNNFYENYGYILDKIPFDQRLQFIKTIFTDQYPEEEFENNVQFYRTKLYKLMTADEREKWALGHIESGNELLGSDKVYKWYRFVSFDKAFDVIKKYIMVTENVDTRNNMLTLLVKAAKTADELKILFDYYYERHVNEQKYNKELFVNAVLSEHNVYNWSISCWDAFNKILYSLEVYNLGYHSCNASYRVIALTHHVIHGKLVPEALTSALDSSCPYFKGETNKLSKEQEEIVYEYVLKYYLDKIKQFEDKTYKDEVKCDMVKYLNCVLDLMYSYDKSKADIPEIVNKYINLESCDHYFLTADESKVNQVKVNMQQQLIGYLKKDKELVISKLSLIKDQIIKNESCCKLNTFLKIIKSYFSDDLAGLVLKLFKDVLVVPNPHLGAIKTAVYGILVLADNDFKTDFIAKHVPIEAKINHRKIERDILYIQKSICNMACYSRPTLPLSDIMKYIKGDYIYFCLPVLGSYMAELPKSFNIEIVKSLLDTPLSVQKHGIRLAFKCFSVNDLRKLISDVWINTKSVTLRSVIYAAFLKEIVSVHENDQNVLFEDLKSMTSSLREDDDEKIFRLLTSDCLPQRFIGDYLEVAWNVVDRLPEKNKFLAYRTKVIAHIGKKMRFMNKEFLNLFINAHMNLLMEQDKIKAKNNENDYRQDLIQSKRTFVYNYVSFFTDDNDFRKKADLVMVVIKEIVKKWNTVENNEYIYKRILSNFLNNLNDYSYKWDVKNYAKTNVIFEQILKELEDTLPNEEIYEIIWKIRILIITRNIRIDVKTKPVTNTKLNMVVRESLSSFAKEFASLLIQAIENRKCYVSFFDAIQELLIVNLHLVLNLINWKEKPEKETNNTRVVISSELLEYKSFETYMFAVKLLPWNIGQCIDRNECVNVIKKLKSCEYDEVKCCMYDKFVTTDLYI